MTTLHERRGALEAIDRILNRSGDSDGVLSDVVGVLARLFPHVRVDLLAGGAVIRGPAAGTGGGDASRWVVSYERRPVAELVVEAAGPDDRELLERTALLIGPYCVVDERRARALRTSVRPSG